MGIKTKREEWCLCGLSLNFSVESRGIWQLPSTLWHLPLPCAPGMLGCLHYWHTGQECGDERGLAGVERETIWKHVHISTGSLLHCLSLSLWEKTFPALRQRCSDKKKKKRGPPSPLLGATLERKGKVKTKTTAITIRRNFQREEGKLSNRVPLPGKSSDTVSWQWTYQSVLTLNG